MKKPPFEPFEGSTMTHMSWMIKNTWECMTTMSIVSFRDNYQTESATVCRRRFVEVDLYDTDQLMARLVPF